MRGAIAFALSGCLAVSPAAAVASCVAEPRLKIAPEPNLSPEQARVEAELIATVQDAARADALYDRIADTIGGKVIGTDAARFLAPDYDTYEGRIRNTPATGNAALAYADDRYMRVITRPPPPKAGHPRPIVLFTAGGVASGKTTSISEEVFTRASLVRDGTMRDVAKDFREIQTALDNGWDVQLTYIQRPFDLVVDGAIERAARTGRWGLLAQLPEIHMLAQRSFSAVAEHFKDNARVDIRALYNTWSPDRPVAAREIPGKYPAELLQLLGQGLPGVLAPGGRPDH
jgi:hypothetical protein